MIDLAALPEFQAMRSTAEKIRADLAASGARLDAREAASAKATAAAAEQAEGAELSEAPEVKPSLDETIAALLARDRSAAIERGRILHEDLVRAGDHAAAERLVTAMREGLRRDEVRRGDPMNKIAIVPYGRPGGLDLHESVRAAFLAAYPDPPNETP